MVNNNRHVAYIVTAMDVAKLEDSKDLAAATYIWPASVRMARIRTWADGTAHHSRSIVLRKTAFIGLFPGPDRLAVVWSLGMFGIRR